MLTLCSLTLVHDSSEEPEELPISPAKLHRSRRQIISLSDEEDENEVPEQSSQAGRLFITPKRSTVAPRIKGKGKGKLSGEETEGFQSEQISESYCSSKSFSITGRSPPQLFGSTRRSSTIG
jgi:hypothetical protein